MTSFESVSTWRQDMPSVVSAQRAQLLDQTARAVIALSPHRLRVAVDGYTAAGKTTFGHELAAAVRAHGRSTARASLDDFKFPWRHAREHGYDRVTGRGYYDNAYDFLAARQLLLEPAGPDGSGRVVLCAFDPLTGEDQRRHVDALPHDTVLIVDSVFAFRLEYNAFWDYRIWLDISPERALRHGIERDTAREGRDEATRVHRDRYHAAESIYLAEVDARALADIVIDNSDYNAPHRRDMSVPTATVGAMPDLEETYPAEPPVAGDETATLLGTLERVRATFAWKCEGLDAAGMRATLGPSTMTLGGLLKHLALVEDDYFSVRLRGREPRPPWDAVDWDADPDWEWRTAAEDTPEQLLSLWREAVSDSRSAVTEALADGGLDHPVARGWPDAQSPSLRRILVDLIEEYARHTGHADLIRESVDGLVGEGKPH